MSDMLDVGARGGPPINQQDGFVELKTKLTDPVAYFLGEEFSGVLLPESKSEYTGFHRISLCDSECR